MKIACVTPTYKRPLLLGRAIHCFLQQTHTDAELVILDDAGQYHNQAGERWRLVSTGTRYPNFGAKRNAVIDLVSPDVEGILCWDDDDVYWPWAVEATSRALECRPWAQCRLCLESVGADQFRRVHAFGRGERNWAYGGCWAWRLDAFRTVGEYDQIDDGDDANVARKLYAKYGSSANSTADCEPWYWYNRTPGHKHINDEGLGFWALRNSYPGEPVERIAIGWNGPNIYQYPILPGVHPRDW